MFRRIPFVAPFVHETPGAAAAGPAPAAPAPNGGAPETGGAPPAEQQSGLYEQFLTDVPEELRPYVQEQFREWDRGVTPKLQEAAQIREKLGPLAEIEGVDQIAPEAMQGLVELHNMIVQSESDPTAFTQWLQMANEAMGLTPGELDEESWAAMGEERGWFEGGDGGEEPANIEEHPVVQQLMERLEAAEGKLSEQELSQTTAQERQQLETRMSEEMAKFGEMDEETSKEIASAIIGMAHGFADQEDPIGMAAEQVRKLRGGAIGAAAERDLEQPGGALSGGTANTAPQGFAGFDDPQLKAATAARLRQG